MVKCPIENSLKTNRGDMRMDVMDVIKAAAKQSKTRLTAIGPAMGKAATYVSTYGSKGAEPSASNAARMLEVCGWRLCAMQADQVPTAALIIGDDAKDAERIKAARRADLQQRINALQDELNALD